MLDRFFTVITNMIFSSVIYTRLSAGGGVDEPDGVGAWTGAAVAGAVYITASVDVHCRGAAAVKVEALSASGVT